MESTLSLRRKDLEAEVAANLGWGRGAEFGQTAWDARKQLALESFVKSGLRQFYFPPPQNGIQYDWSFLKPTATIIFASGASTMELPDDFGGLEGQITIHGDNNHFYPVSISGEGVIRQLYSGFPDATGRPQYAAARPKRMPTGETGQRQELYIYPTADDDYTLNVPYYLLPNALDGTREYAYGGMAHAETILESCLAIAEQRLDDKVGIHTGKFMERLAASINHDRRNKQQAFGYNRDCSDERATGVYPRFWQDQTVTLAGQAP